MAQSLCPDPGTSYQKTLHCLLREKLGPREQAQAVVLAVEFH